MVKIKIDFKIQLITEWYQYNDYNIKKKTGNGIIAYNPKNKEMVHIEIDLLQKSYKNHGENHYERFKKAEKFYKNRLGVDSKKVKKVSIIHSTPPTSKDQIKVFESASDSIFKHMKDVLYEIYQKIKNKDPSSDIISQNYPFLRFFQAIISFFEVKTK